jgi:hypothetical protein
MSAAAFRLISFLVLAAAAGVLWADLFHSTGGSVSATRVIPSFRSQSVFAPTTGIASGRTVNHIVQNQGCKGCSVHAGSGGLVRAEVPSGAGKRTAYALIDLPRRESHGPVLIHDVIGFGRGEAPAERARLLQVLDSSHRLIFELAAGPDRRLYLTSPAGGLRATPLVLATGAIVPNDGISGVAIDVVVKENSWVLVSVNGLRTAAVHGLSGARTGAPRFLAVGVIGYKAPPHAAAVTATHAQVSVSTPSTPATAAAAAPQAVPPARPSDAGAALSSLSPPTLSGSSVVGGTLTAAPGSWSDSSATFTYAWERCDGNGSCVAIDGVQGRTYELVPVDTDAYIRVRVTAHVADVSVSRTSASVGPVIPAAPEPLTGPSISGEAVVGAQLSADPGRWTDPEAAFAFVWERCDDAGACRPIHDAVDATYLVSAKDLGRSLVVAVTASNAGGSNEADSQPTEVVVPAAPTVVAGPTISGDATVGSTLTADPGTWSDPAATFTYAWLRCHGSGGCSTIDGVDGTKYVLTGDDVGFRIEVGVTAANAGGTGTANSDPVGPVVPQSPPTVVTAPSVSGETTVGSTLTADPGTWSDPAATFAYAWLRCDGSSTCTGIDGADGKAYTLTNDDVSFRIEVAVTATNAGGSAVADSALVGPVLPDGPPANISAPTISGDATVGSTLTADPGTWSDRSATLDYAWLRCDGSGTCKAIDGAQSTTYTLTTDDLGSLVAVEVTASNVVGSSTADAKPVGPVAPGGPPVIVNAPSITGDATVGSILTGDPGTWSDPAATLTYVWLRCYGSGPCSAVDRANAITHPLTDDDLGSSIRFEVTASDEGGTAKADSPPTDPVGLAGPGDLEPFALDPILANLRLARP